MELICYFNSFDFYFFFFFCFSISSIFSELCKYILFVFSLLPHITQIYIVNLSVHLAHGNSIKFQVFLATNSAFSSKVGESRPQAQMMDKAFHKAFFLGVDSNSPCSLCNSSQRPRAWISSWKWTFPPLAMSAAWGRTPCASYSVWALLDLQLLMGPQRRRWKKGSYKKQLWLRRAP